MKNNMSRIEKLMAQGMGILPENAKFDKTYDISNYDMPTEAKPAKKPKRGTRSRQIAKAKVLREKALKKHKKMIKELKKKGRPTIPKKEKPKKINDVVKPIPVPTPEDEPRKSDALIQAEEDLNVEVQNQLDSDKVRLMDILGEYNQFITREDTDKIVKAIEAADAETIQAIWNIMPSDDWKDFYKMLSGYYANVDVEDVQDMLDQIAEMLGVELKY